MYERIVNNYILILILSFTLVMLTSYNNTILFSFNGFEILRIYLENINIGFCAFISSV